MVGELFGIWWERAGFRYLLQGLPAVIVTGVFLVPLVGAGKTSHEYELAAREALKQADSETNEETKKEKLKTAEICLTVLAQLDAKNATHTFQLAQTAELLGDHEKAFALDQFAGAAGPCRLPPGPHLAGGTNPYQTDLPSRFARSGSTPGAGGVSARR